MFTLPKHPKVDLEKLRSRLNPEPRPSEAVSGTPARQHGSNQMNHPHEIRRSVAFPNPNTESHARKSVSSPTVMTPTAGQPEPRPDHDVQVSPSEKASENPDQAETSGEQPSPQTNQNQTQKMPTTNQRLYATPPLPAVPDELEKPLAINLSQILKDRMAAKQVLHTAMKNTKSGTHGSKNVSFNVKDTSHNYYHNGYRDGSVVYKLEDLTSPSFLERKSFEDTDDDYHYYDRMLRQGFDSLEVMRRRHLPQVELQKFTHNQIWLYISVSIVLLTGIVASICSLVFVFVHQHWVPIHFPDAVGSSTLPLAFREQSLSNAHMIIMIIPVIQLRLVATLIYRMFPRLSVSKLKWVHGTLQVTSSAATVYGVTFSFGYHAICERAQFYSMHSYFALLSLGLHLIALATGLAFVLPCFSWECRATFAPFHKCIGSLVIITDGACVCTGFVQRNLEIFKGTLNPQHGNGCPPGTVALNTACLCLCVESLLVSYLQAHPTFRRREKDVSPMETDLDTVAIHNVARRRHKRAIAKEAKEFSEKQEQDEVQLGSRKSYNYAAARHQYWTDFSPGSERTIVALVNEAEMQKRNFDDEDLFIALE